MSDDIAAWAWEPENMNAESPACIPLENSTVQSFASFVEEPQARRLKPESLLSSSIVDQPDQVDFDGKANSKSYSLPPEIDKLSISDTLNALTARRMLNLRYLLDRAGYKLDTYISSQKGQIIVLCILGFCTVTVGGCILKLAEPELVWADSVWDAWTYISAPLAHTTLDEPELRITGILITVTGIIYFSVIMGFIVDVIRITMDDLKKGKSKVTEQGHTLMLGWTDKSISFIRQLCLANESDGGGVIIVLAEVEKETLEAELESHLQTEKLRGTKVIFRTGTPLLTVDLLKVCAHLAKSIVIMSNTTGDADRSDSAALRTVLSLKTLPTLAGHILVELRDIDNAPLVRIVGGQQVDILVSHDVIGRLILMAARSSGVASAFAALLGFEGNEFNVKEWPECVGITFGCLSERFPNAIPLGIKTAAGNMHLFPDFGTVVQTGDQILVLAEDDDTYKACPPVEIDPGSFSLPHEAPQLSERILMCGWRRDIRDMIKLLDHLVAPGTEVHMICKQSVHERNEILAESGLDVKTLCNIKLVHHVGNSTTRRHLDLMPLHSFTSMMILVDESRETDIMHSDSHSLASLLLIRDLQSTNSSSSSVCKCITEILDPRTQKTVIASTTILQLSEFIETNEVVSCILAMISENRDVRVILDELLGPDGSSFEVKPSTQYCTPAEELSFWQLAKRAMFEGKILCGYQTGADVSKTVLNPSEKSKARTWVNVNLILLRSKERKPTARAQSKVSRHRDLDDSTLVCEDLIGEKRVRKGTCELQIRPLAHLCGLSAGRYLTKS